MLKIGNLKPAVGLGAVLAAVLAAGEPAPQPQPQPKTEQPAATTTQPSTGPVAPQPGTPVAPPPRVAPGTQPGTPSYPRPGPIQPGPAGMRPNSNPLVSGGTPPAPLPGVAEMTHPGYLNELAQVHLRYGALERAEPLLRTVIEQSKDPQQRQQAVSTLAGLYQNKKDLKAAEKLWEEVLATPSQPAPVAPGAASTSYDPAQGQKQAALRALISIWQQQPGRLEEVIKEADAKLEKDPNDSAALERLAEIYTNGPKADGANAAACYEKLSALRPNDKMLQHRVLWSYRQTNQYDKAIEIYRKMMASSATKDEAGQHAFQIALLMKQAGKKDEAAAFIKTELARPDAGSRELALLAMFYEQSGMSQDAEAALRQAASSAKTPAEKAEGALRVADFLIRQKDFARAEEQVRRVMEEHKADNNIQQRASLVLKRLEAYKAGPPPAPVSAPAVGPAPAVKSEVKNAPTQQPQPQPKAETPKPQP